MVVEIKEYEEIKKMDDFTLLKEFENLISRGAGPDFLMVRWMRKEFLKRMNKNKDE